MIRALELFVAFCVGAAVGAVGMLAIFERDLEPLDRIMRREGRR